MAVVAPAEPRAVTTETPAGLEILVPAKRNWFATAFLGFWLCGWAVGEVMVLLQFLSGEMPMEGMLFTVVWLCGWTVGGGFALYVFWWSLVGRERVLLGPGRISLRREIFGWGRSREYELVHVRRLRASANKHNAYDFRSGLQFWGIGGGSIAFDHGSATVQFGAGLEESEAQSLVERLLARGNFADHSD